jgi:hypothetical protein
MGSWARRATNPSALALVVPLALFATGCVAVKPEGPVVGVSTPGGAAVARFKFDSLDDRPVSSDALLGKPAVIAFVTTWDLASQAQVSFLVAMARRDQGRVGYAVIVLGERADRELAESYRNAIAPPFPMAQTDVAGASSAGFGEVRAVPAIVVLDAAGRVVLRRDGLSKPEEIRPALQMSVSPSPR